MWSPRPRVWWNTAVSARSAWQMRRGSSDWGNGSRRCRQEQAQLVKLCNVHRSSKKPPRAASRGGFRSPDSRREDRPGLQNVACTFFCRRRQNPTVSDPPAAATGIRPQTGCSTAAPRLELGTRLTTDDGRLVVKHGVPCAAGAVQSWLLVSMAGSLILPIGPVMACPTWRHHANVGYGEDVLCVFLVNGLPSAPMPQMAGASFDVQEMVRTSPDQPTPSRIHLQSFPGCLRLVRHCPSRCSAGPSQQQVLGLTWGAW